jgi:hypothetical protein
VDADNPIAIRAAQKHPSSHLFGQRPHHRLRCVEQRIRAPDEVVELDDRRSKHDTLAMQRIEQSGALQTLYVAVRTAQRHIKLGRDSGNRLHRTLKCESPEHAQQPISRVRRHHRSQVRMIGASASFVLLGTHISFFDFLIYAIVTYNYTTFLQNMQKLRERGQVFHYHMIMKDLTVRSNSSVSSGLKSRPRSFPYALVA